MRILIVTPLYPPDLSRVAVYVKELAQRLSRTHEVSVVTYGHLPEEIAGVPIHAVPRNLPIPLRMVMMLCRIWNAARHCDALLVCDGASVGVPAVLAGWFRGIPRIRCVMEDEALERMAPEQQLEWHRAKYAPDALPTMRLKMINRIQLWALAHSTCGVLSRTELKQRFVESYRCSSSRLQILFYPPAKKITLPFSIPERTDRVLYQHELSAISQAEQWYLLQSACILVLDEVVSPNGVDDIFRAYMAEIPIIAIDMPRYREVIQTDITGLLVPSDDAHAMSEAVVRLIRDTDLRKHLINGGKRFMQEHVDWDAHITCLQNVCETARGVPPHV